MPVPFARSASQTRPTFSRDFAGLKTLDHGVGPAITFTRGSNATYFNAAGVLTTATTNEPRFDHSATGSSLGLLIEEARTNLLLRSAQLDDTSWLKLRLAISSNVITAPDGTVSADKLVEDATNNTHLVYQARAASNETVTFSVFAKAGERSSIVLQLSNFLDSACNARFDLAAKTAFAPSFSGADYSNLSSSITEIGDGWFRCVFTATKAAVNTVNNPTINLFNGASQYTGDGTSGLFIWGAQLEAGAFPTSYIPTTSAAATRAADSAVVTPISSFYNQSEGTLFAEYSGSAANRGIAHFDNNTNSHRFAIIAQVGTYIPYGQVVNNSSDQAVIAVGSSPSPTEIVKFVFAASENNFQAGRGGTLGTADTTGVMPSAALTHLNLGSIALSGNTICGHLRKLAYWPKRLSNTLLQQLTT